MHYLFSYGTLQTLAVQEEVFGTALDGEPDALVGFSLAMVEITDPEVLALSGERFHPIVSQTHDPSDRVSGTVFAMTDEQLRRADAYEVDDYERTKVSLASGRTAWLYVAKTSS